MLHIVLHQPEYPDNAGNVGRTCVALGAKLWLVRPLGFRLRRSAPAPCGPRLLDRAETPIIFLAGFIQISS